MANPPRRKKDTAKNIANQAKRLKVLQKPADWRPKTRADCEDVPRPCPYVGCRYNIFLDVTPFGTLRFRQDDNWEGHFDGRDNCALDIAARGPSTLQEIADVTGVCRERVRQELDMALEKIRPSLKAESQIAGTHHTHSYAESPEDAAMVLCGLDPKNIEDRHSYRRLVAAVDGKPR